MSTAGASDNTRMSASFRKAWRATKGAVLLGVLLGAVAWLWPEHLRPVRHYLLFIQSLVFGNAFGRIHQASLEAPPR